MVPRSAKNQRPRTRLSRTARMTRPDERDECPTSSSSAFTRRRLLPGPNRSHQDSTRIPLTLTAAFRDPVVGLGARWCQLPVTVRYEVVSPGPGSTPITCLPALIRRADCLTDRSRRGENDDFA